VNDVQNRLFLLHNHSLRHNESGRWNAELPR
jgi:hypothetical protein